MWMRAAAVASLASALLSSQGQGQNLVVNGRFNSSLAGWTQGYSADECDSTVHDPSGTARTSCDGTGALTWVSGQLEQCIVIPGATAPFDKRFDLAFDSLTFGLNDQVFPKLLLYPYASNDCSGNSLPFDALTHPGATAGEPWHTALATLDLPPSTDSLRLVLSVDVWNSYGGAYFDNVELRRTPARGDFNGDKRSDLLLRDERPASAAYPYTVWHLTNGTATSSSTIGWNFSDSTFRVAGVADFDNDGDPDLMLRQYDTGYVWFVRLSGVMAQDSGPLNGIASPTLEWEVAATGDFNKDRVPDIVWRNTQSQALKVWAMKPGDDPYSGVDYLYTITPVPAAAAHANWSVVAAADYNDDADTDLLWYNSTSGKIVQWLMNEDLVRIEGRFTEPSNAGNNNWKVVASADYGKASMADTDFVPDVVWRNESSGKLVLWFLEPNGARTSGIFLTPDSPTPPLSWGVAGPR